MSHDSKGIFVAAVQKIRGWIQKLKPLKYWVVVAIVTLLIGYLILRVLIDQHIFPL